MYRFLLRPKWVAFTLLVALAAVGMLFLARWQWQRHHERADFNEQVRTNSQMAPEPLDAVLAQQAGGTDPEWRRVIVTGTYLPSPRFSVVNRSQNGQPGRNDVAALQLADGTVVLVNRGFVVLDDDIPPLPSGDSTVTGQLRRSEQRRRGQPADDPDQQLTAIRRIDLDVLAGQFDAPLRPVYLQVLSADPPQPAELQPIAPPSLDGGPHLSYTVQWIIFSVAVLVGWVFAVRRSSRLQQPRTGAVSSEYR
jgi:cytochrome oxidase assembly protein ShyY1